MAQRRLLSATSTRPPPGSRAAMPPCSPPYCRTRSGFRRLRRRGTFSSGVNGYWIRCRRWAARKCWMKSTPIRACITEPQYFADDGRNFEYRAILNTRDAGTILVHARRQRGYALADGSEGVEHQAGAVLLHPVGVVPLLRHGPDITHHDDGQPLLDGLADAAGTGLADEEIAELHEVADLRRESDDGAGRGAVHR